MVGSSAGAAGGLDSVAGAGSGVGFWERLVAEFAQAGFFQEENFRQTEAAFAEFPGVIVREEFHAFFLHFGGVDVPRLVANAVHVQAAEFHDALALATFLLAFLLVATLVLPAFALFAFVLTTLALLVPTHSFLLATNRSWVGRGGVSGLFRAIGRLAVLVPGLPWFSVITIFPRLALFALFPVVALVPVFPGFRGLSSGGGGGFFLALVRKLIGGFGFLSSGFHRGRCIIVLVIRVVGRPSRLAAGGLLHAYGFVGFETGALALIGEAGFVLHVKIIAMGSRLTVISRGA